MLVVANEVRINLGIREQRCELTAPSSDNEQRLAN